MYGWTRGTLTLVGVAGAGVLLWLASQLDVGQTGEYWAWTGLLAAGGLAAALSQLLGGWTKWGWPRVSGGVFLLGFVPALVAGGLVVLHGQPDPDAFGANWAGELGVGGLADELAGSVLPAIALGLGLLLGLTLDTTGPRPHVERAVSGRDLEQPADRGEEMADEGVGAYSGPGAARRDRALQPGHRAERKHRRLFGRRKESTPAR